MKHFFICVIIMNFLIYLPYSYSNETKDNFKDIQENRKTHKSGNSHGYHFRYGNGPNGPKFWGILYPTCRGQNQSPIDINLLNVQEVKIEKLKWENYSELPTSMTEINNGHTISIKAVLPNNATASISGGPLTTTYTFQSLHFHWGMVNTAGSEHSLDKKLYPMEMHCIHQQKGLPFDVAASSHNGLVVLAYFFELSSNDNPAINSILEEYNQLMVDVGMPLNFQNTFKLDDLIIPFNKDYITYQGSLTTPPCTESVIWIISPYPSYISVEQIVKFRKISEATGMENNYRPVQWVGNRTIYLVA